MLQYSLAAFHFPSHGESASLDLTPNSSTTKFQHFIEAQRNVYHTEFEFYQQCYDAVLALALALNKTIEGRQEVAYLMDKRIKQNLKLSTIELKINETVMDIAKGQAGLPPESVFHISHFNYGVKIVANLMEKFLEGTNFIGVSVSIAYYCDNDYPNPSTDNL